MSIKIGLVSDVHASPEPLLEALQYFQRAGVAAIFCPGDIVGYGTEASATVRLLQRFGCRAVIGNHDLWRLEQTAGNDGPVEHYLRTLSVAVETEIAGVSIYMVHASPPASLMDGIRLRDEYGELIPEQLRIWQEILADFPHDILIVGHTHQVIAERLGRTLVINPGSSRFNHSCAILTLPEMTVETVPLEGKEPLLAWNWGMGGLSGS